MTSITEIYFNGEINGNLMTPPDMLLEVITEWVTENPSLCLATQPALALPAGAISMPLVTPLAGLIRWSVLAPIYLPAHESSSYSKLHLAVLQSLSQVH